MYGLVVLQAGILLICIHESRHAAEKSAGSEKWNMMFHFSLFTMFQTSWITVTNYTSVDYM